MEVVRLGDVNVDAYTTAMDSIKALVPRLKKVAVEGDGLGLEQRLGAKKARVEGVATKLHCREADRGSVEGNAISFDVGLLAHRRIGVVVGQRQAAIRDYLKKNKILHGVQATRSQEHHVPR
jgi:hypothetical protein